MKLNFIKKKIVFSPVFFEEVLILIGKLSILPMPASWDVEEESQNLILKILILIMNMIICTIFEISKLFVLCEKKEN